MNSVIAVRNSVVAATMVLAAVAASAETTLLGDSLSFLRAYPDTSSQYLSAIPDTIVVAGTSDRVSWIVSGLTYTTFDPEALRIDVIFPVTADYGTPGPEFDGYVISGFDHDIQSFTVTNGTGFAVTSTLLDPRTIAIDLTGLSSGTYSIGLVMAQPVPEPANVALMAAGLGLLALRARRRAKALNT